jgi:EmrB/QacA subfamily drug resistance transporter
MNYISLPSPAGRGILIATILVSGMAFLDGTVVNLALPALQQSLGATITSLQWIINSYTLMLAAFLLIGGGLGDRYGKRLIYSIGIGLFSVASLGSALAHTIETLIVFRIIQGLGAALMIPGSLAIISSAYNERERGHAIGLWSGFSATTTVAGIFLGGVLIERFGWPSVFYINLPLALLALYLSFRFIPPFEGNRRQTLDWIGSLLIVICLVSLSFALIEAPTLGWGAPAIVTALVGSVISFAALVWVEAQAKHPMIPLHIIKSPVVLGANLVTLLIYFALSSSFMLLTLNFQQVQGYSATFTAIAFLPFTLLLIFLSGYGGKLGDRFGPRLPLFVGSLLIALGLFLLAQAGVEASFTRSFLPGLLLWGLGMTGVVAPVTKAALAVGPHYAGAASGFNNAISRIASLLAIAVIGIMLLGVFKTQVRHELLSTMLSAAEQAEIIGQEQKLAGIAIPSVWNLQKQAEAKTAVHQAFVHAYRYTMWLNVGLAVLSAMVVLMVLPKGKEEALSPSR